MEIKRTLMEGRVPVTIFKITGKLNATAPLLNEAKIAFDGGARHMLFDLTGVPYISSAGFKSFHEIHNLLRNGVRADKPGVDGAQDGKSFSPYIKLLNPSELVTEILKVLGFDQYLEVHTDLGKAIASF